MDGNIFSIEEFSTFDGPGVRCTVFLKGCPLACMWCHNPEGQSFSTQFLRSPNGCTGCGACLEEGRKETGTACLVENSISACPNHLVRQCGESLSPETLISKLENKLWMLNAAGGGVTFSGGEPLSQPDFLLECLRLLQGKTHRALQTSGFAPETIFQSVLSECEYVLYDLKLMDSSMHRRYTGQYNTRILQNYRTLVASGIDFITRIPLIPGVNDTKENLQATAAFLSQLSVPRIELLPYNRSAGAKYRSLGRSYITDFDEDKAPDPRTDLFQNYGIEVSVL